ncbi:MAG: hypothetical protein RMY34_19915 [Aulosira sp. DedQUE10]|nr:hypothetical protein [Aulosira sp. DedQUE10]
MRFCILTARRKLVALRGIQNSSSPKGRGYAKKSFSIVATHAPQRPTLRERLLCEKGCAQRPTLREQLCRTGKVPASL